MGSACKVHVSTVCSKLHRKNQNSKIKHKLSRRFTVTGLYKNINQIIQISRILNNVVKQAYSAKASNACNNIFRNSSRNIEDTITYYDANEDAKCRV